MIKLILTSCLFLVLFKENLIAQAGAGMKLGPQHQHYLDSIRNSNYKWRFPVWGKKLSKKGFDLQYPFGMMLNPFTGSQKINISDLKVGFNGNAPVPFDFIKFGEVKAYTQSITIRPDVWIFPFLDLYGIAGATWAQTDVTVVEPIQFKTSAKFNGSTFGIGTTLAGGYHSLIFITDINHTWTSMDKIKGSIQATMVSPRVGKNFVFKKRPDRNIAIWVGAPGIFINRTTEGTVDLGDLHGNALKTDLENIVNGTSPWYQQLNVPQQIVAKDIAQKLLDKINGLDIKGATVSYSLNKKPTSNWSMCAGGQFQLNHHWQFRVEAGFLGGRSSLLVSTNYRWRW